MFKPSFIKIGSRSQTYVQISVPKWEKLKSWKNVFRLENGTIRGSQIGVGFRDYKLGPEGLQKGVALGISNRGEKITNRGRDYKLEQNNCFVTKHYYITRILSSQIDCYRKNTIRK